MSKAILVLEDGRAFEGVSFGAAGESFGEIVFNTSMSGYQEILTDPSYAGQIVTMTYPLIGNYGVNDEDVESRRPWVEGFVVREASRIVSNYRSTESLQDYLKRHNIVGIEHIDTRALVRHIRAQGAMRAGISTVDTDTRSLLDKVLASPQMTNRELASAVTIEERYEYEKAETRPVGSVRNLKLRNVGHTRYRSCFRLKYFPIPNKLIASQKNSTTKEGKLNAYQSETSTSAAPTAFISEYAS